MYSTRYLMLLSLLVAATQAQITLMPEDTSYPVVENVGSFNICLNFTQSPSDDVYTIMCDVSPIPGSPQANDPSDYSIDACMIEISENDTSPVCITVNVMNDGMIERDESFRVTFSGEDVTFTMNTVDVTITDDDGDVTVTFMDNSNVQEGESYSLCANASPSNYELSFSIMASITNGTADASDVILSPTEVQFNSGDTMKCFNITIVDDDGPEPSQYLNITYSVTDDQSSNVVLSNAVTRVVIAGQLVITGPVTNVNEGDTFCAELNGPSDGTIAVNYNIVDVTATSDDYDAPTGMFIFPNGDTSACFINITDDTIVENTESFTVTFSDPVGASLSSANVTVNIIDNDAASIGFSNTAISISENSSSNLMISRNTTTIAFNFTISASSREGTAKAGDDFYAITNVEYEWTNTSTPMIDIALVDDNIVEYDESFTVVITSSRDNIVVSDSTATITIIDDDMSVISTAPSVSVMESEGSRDICFSISRPIAPKVNISYTVSGTATEGDFSIPPSPLMLPSLSTDDVCIAINIINDDVMEDNETIILRWTLDSDLPAGVTLQSSDTTITIIDNDVPTTTMATPTSTTPISTTSTSTTPTSTTSSSILNTITIIYIVVGVVAAGLLCLLILCCVVLCVKVRLNRQGFYFTEENKGDAPRMLRYSASLRSISSQTVLPMDTREKENEYMV